MKRSKLYALVAIVATMLSIACSNDKIDDELNASEAKRVAFAEQFIEVYLSNDLREAADVVVSCIGLDHNSIDIPLPTTSDRTRVSAELPIEAISYPCALTITITVTPKAEFAPELNRVYNFKYWVRGVVRLDDINRKVLAVGDDTEDGSFSVVAQENTPWSALLNISPIVTSVRVVERTNGSLEIED